MKLSIFAIAFLSTLSVYGDLGGQIVGVWHGTSGTGQEIKVEFSEEGNYNLTLNGQNLTADTGEFGQIKYELVADQGSMEIRLYDEKTDKEYSRLQATVTSDDKLELVLYVNEEPTDKLQLRRVTTP